MRVAELYPADEFDSTFERAKTAFGDTVFTCQYANLSRSLVRLITGRKGLVHSPKVAERRDPGCLQLPMEHT